MTTTNPSLNLPPPKFNIDENDQNIELWTFRLPVDVPLSALQNATLDLTSSEGTGITTLTHNDKTFHLEVGTSQENEFFRVLLPKSTSSEDSDKDSDDDDDDDDDDDESKPASNMLLYPSAKPFTRHINVLSSVPKKSEIELAPREGPTPVDPMRHAYAHVPQRTGLKRRWMPSGVPSSKMAVPVAAVAKNTKPVVPKKGETPAAKKIKTEPIVIDTPDSPSTVEDKELSKEERRALKSEKKAAKKAKKEAKKAKKAAKKAKKEKSED